MLEETRTSGWTTCASGHGGFQPPNRCAKRTGKREGNRSGESSFFPDRFPSLFLCPEASNFSQPRVTGGGCLFSPASYFANYGSRDEPRATACGGCFARGEINRNEQCPHEADLRRLSLRKLTALVGGRSARKTCPLACFQRGAETPGKPSGGWFSVEAGRQPW